MNIFKSLSQGHGRISETNLTSFLSYLLNSSNELNNAFILLFVELLDKELKDQKLSSLLGLDQETFREKNTQFSKKYSVTAVPEFSYRLVSSEIEYRTNKTKQISDILLIISTSGDKGLDIAYILIENKINRFSIHDKNQISNQYNYFINSNEYQKGLPVYSVLLTVDDSSFQSMFENGKLRNPDTVWLKWTNQSSPDSSVEAILKTLILMDHLAEIQPINPNSQFIIKSFIDYIATEFSVKKGGGLRNMSINGAEVVESTEVMINNRILNIKRFDNKSIRVYDNNEVEQKNVISILRDVVESYNLNIDLNHSDSNQKNTRTLGKEVIEELNKKFRNY